MANTILEKIQEKYPGVTDDARNIAEALAMAYENGGRGAGAIADQFFATEEGGERVLIYEGTIQSTGQQGTNDSEFTPLTSDLVWDAVRVTYDGKEYIIPRVEDTFKYGEYDFNLMEFVFTTYPVGITIADTTAGVIFMGDPDKDHQIKIEGEGSCGPIMVDLVVPELKDRTELTSGPSTDLVRSLIGMVPSPDPALVVVRLVVTGKGTYTPPDYYYPYGDMAGQCLDVNFTVDGDPWCVILNTTVAQGAHKFRSGHFGTDPNN